MIGDLDGRASQPAWRSSVYTGGSIYIYSSATQKRSTSSIDRRVLEHYYVHGASCVAVGDELTWPLLLCRRRLGQYTGARDTKTLYYTTLRETSRVLLAWPAMNKSRRQPKAEELCTLIPVYLKSSYQLRPRTTQLSTVVHTCMSCLTYT